MKSKLERLGLKTIHVPVEIAAVVNEQVRPIVQLHVSRFSAWTNVKEAMERLAFDCYSQGLIHGNQVPHVVPPTQGD